MLKKQIVSHDGVEVMAEKPSHQGFFELRTLTLKHALFNGGFSQAIEREVFIRHDAVAILPYDPVLDKVVLVEQLRMGALYRESSPWLLEMVAGIVDTAESLSQVAIREAQEEAGLGIEAIEPICEYFPSPGGSCEYLSLFCGKADLTVAGGIFGLDSENEDIRAHLVDFSQLVIMLEKGLLQDAQTIIATQWLMLNRERILALWS